MPDLERRLADVAAHVAFPTTPEVWPAVTARLGERPRPRVRLSAAVALGTVVVVAAVAAALGLSAEARSTVFGWFGIGGVRIELVDDLPEVPIRSMPVYGQPVTLAAAQRVIPFRILVPDVDGLGEPDHVYVRDDPPGGTVTLIWGQPMRPRLALSQWLGETLEPVFLKVVGPGTDAQFVVVDGAPGMWLDEAPHVVYTHGVDGREYSEDVFLAGNTLIWEEGRGARMRSFRLELEGSLGDALTIARSLPSNM